MPSGAGLSRKRINTSACSPQPGCTPATQQTCTANTAHPWGGAAGQRGVSSDCPSAPGGAEAQDRRGAHVCSSHTQAHAWTRTPRAQTHAHTQTHADMQTRAHMYTHEYVHEQVCSHAYRHTNMQTSAHVCAQVHATTHTNTPKRAPGDAELGHAHLTPGLTGRGQGLATPAGGSGSPTARGRQTSWAPAHVCDIEPLSPVCFCSQPCWDLTPALPREASPRAGGCTGAWCESSRVCVHACARGGGLKPYFRIYGVFWFCFNSCTISGPCGVCRATAGSAGSWLPQGLQVDVSPRPNPLRFPL